MDKHLLILDLDETLIYSAETALDRVYDFRVGQFFVYRRPFLTEFLAAAFEWFDVAVWSSANAPYVHTVVGRLFPQPDALRFVWACDRCTQRFDAEELTNYWIKDLKKVKRLGYSLERVLMIDDMITTVAIFEPLKIYDDPEALFQEGWMFCDVGDHQRGLKYMQQAVAGGYFPAATLAEQPHFDALRDQPAFQTLLADAEAGRRVALDAFRAAGGDRLLAR